MGGKRRGVRGRKGYLEAFRSWMAKVKAILQVRGEGIQEADLVSHKVSPDHRHRRYDRHTCLIPYGHTE